MKYPKLISIVSLLSLSLFLSIRSSLAATQGSSQTAVVYGPSTNTTLQTGLVGWWTFDGADTTTSTALDKSGQNNTATKYGVVPTGGKIGQGINFKPDLNTYGLNAGTNISSVRSASIWFELNSCSRLARLFQLGSNQYSPYVTTLCSLHVIYNGSDWVSPKVFSATELNKWMLFTSTFDGTVLKMYLNGSFVASTTMTTNDASATLIIGNISPPGGGNQGWNGALDDLRLYTRVLSPIEVTALYKLGQNKMSSSQTAKPITGNTLKNGLVGWWTFDGADTTAVTTTDKSGQGNNGTRTLTTTLTYGKIGQAFDSKYGYISAPDATIDTSQASTFSFWGWARTLPFDKALGGDWSGVNTGYMIYSTTANRMCGYTNNTFGCTTIALKTWNHYIYTYDGVNTSSFYVNSVLRGTKTGVLADGGNIFIGTYFGDSTALFDGKIDDVRIYSRALASTEIIAFYKLGQEKMGSSQTAVPSSPVTGNTLKNGLVGWWTLDGADVNATQALDKSGSGNTGTRTATTPTIGKIGQAMSFNGTTSKISLSSFTTGVNVTMAAWFKSRSTGQSPIFNNYNPSINNGVSFGILNDKLFTFSVGNNPTIFTGNKTINDNKWHFGVYTTDGATSTFYADGVMDRQIAQTRTAGSSTGFIGFGGSANDWWTGSIDDVRVYSRTLSAAEVLQLYKIGK